MELDADTSADVYSLADVIKRYYRELPQSVFTDQLANVLVDIFSCTTLLHFTIAVAASRLEKTCLFHH